jgi:predicted amino acid-binding ACT domain protein
MKNLRLVLSLSNCLLCLGVLLGIQNPSFAAPCGLNFSPNPGTGSVSIELYYYINDSYTSPANLAYFKDIVTVGNTTVPAGTYLGWCIDVSNSIDAGPEVYSTLMYSSCDPNLDAELAGLGATYHFTYPTTDTSTSAAKWNQLNYLLNHTNVIGKTVNYWDIQAAIWNIVGGPLPPNSVWTAEGYTGLIYDTNVVETLTTNAIDNAATWQPTCGDVIAVVLAITAPDKTHDFPVQLTILQIPFPCITLTVGSIGDCYGSLAEADAAALAATTATGGCGGALTLSVSDNGSNCPATIVVKATDVCGDYATASYTATILTSPPTFSGLPSETMTYQCYDEVPPMPIVTATDSCGTNLTVTTNSMETKTGSSCDDVITRSWTAQDCLGQLASFTQTITVQNTVVPVLTKTSIGTCYTSLAAADAAALAATSGSASCGGTVSLTVSDNGQYCPATITVTGTDNCGLTSTVTYTANILTTVPSFGSLPPATASYQCYSEVPTAPAVTATDACGTSLTVTPTSSETIPGSSCGDVITRTWTATDCAGQEASFTETITVQNTTIPTLTKTSIGSCYTSLAAADAAALAATSGTANCGGTVKLTVSDNGQDCPATITVTGTDSCGLVATVTYSAKILTTLPTLIGLPGATGSYQCYSEVPAAAVVTATDSCGLSLTVTPTSSETIPGSSCGDVITRTWTASDCAGQVASFTQTITVQNTTAPTLTKTGIGSCYTSLAAADAAALAATTGTANCGGTVKLKVSDNGEYCPATITVTGTDSCGLVSTVTYTAKILTTLPTLIGLPGATGSYQCASEVPSATVVTATDSCGLALTVTPTTSTSGSPCDQIITRTWTAMDCAGQVASFTQTITVQNTIAPTLTKTSIGSCYTSLAAADAAALAATSGTANCGGTVKLTVSNNGEYCPATITVTGTDNCGLVATVTYTAKILTAPPTLSGCPESTTVQCVSEIPPVTTVTATDSCGLSLTPSYNQTESNPSSTCSNVYTRTWTATDCAGQTATCTQVITQYNNVASTLTCPTNVTICTNLCQMYCTFTPGDWSGSCDGGPRYGNSWWQSWCSKDTSSECWTSWTTWWNSCNGSDHQYTNWWSRWNTNEPTCCWGSWSGGGSDNWWGSWNKYNSSRESWVPCGGSNPDSILTSCFKQVYPKGCVTIGVQGGKCVTLNSCSAVQNCLNFGGTPGVLTGCFTNPSSCGAGSFCAQVLALQLNCDFGDYGCVPGFVGKCGDLVLCDSTSPCNGKRVRDILSICNCALGGGSCPAGCSVSYLTTLCSNLNQCFEGCQVSSWCSSHLCSVYIPTPAQTGTATVTSGCSGSATLTYTDTVSACTSAGSYVISREWIAVDGCNNTNTCTQLITIVSPKRVTSQVCCNFNATNPGGGYVWCNAHISCNPGKACTINCQDASVTLTCNDGRTYTFPVPDCQVNFSPGCTTAGCSFDGTSWTTTLPCAGDDQIFLSGCGIPWQSDFANCHSVCWSGTFSCDVPGTTCNWQWSAACYKCNLGSCGSVNVKSCHNTPCGYPGGDQAGTPENCKPSCQGGACGGGGSNYTGSWSGTESCSF